MYIYIALDYITLRCLALHCNTLPYLTLYHLTPLHWLHHVQACAFAVFVYTYMCITRL